MIIILHRGNTKGRNLKKENCPNHIQNILNQSNFQIEIDVWFKNKNFYLGHDNPQYKIDNNFLLQKNLWCHAKNLKALKELLQMNVICFWHESDDYTLTSNNFIWTYPNKKTIKNSIIVDLNKNWKTKNYNCYGVCVDYI